MRSKKPPLAESEGLPPRAAFGASSARSAQNAVACGSLLALILCLLGAITAAQTTIVAPKNSYKLSDDVELGKKAAADVEKEMPILDDERVTAYVRRLGDALAAAVPEQFQHKEFHYSFAVTDVKDINAFALPGGPMFVHRGLIEAAGSEAELAGVMAHEMSHVALRHGTAQMSKAKPGGFLSILGAAGAVVGIAIGGGTGRIVADATEFGVSSALLRYSRDDEKQADLLGIRIMARAGYDPRALAHMFETIEKEGGSRPPQWLSDHPNPGNRVEYIREESQFIIIEHPIEATPAFDQIRDHLKTLPAARTLEEIAKAKKQTKQPPGR